MIFDRLDYNFENEDEKKLKYLKTSAKKIYIYGNGARAVATYQMLHAEDIDIIGYIVDSDYYESNFDINGVRVYTFSNIKDDMQNIILVIGFDNVEKTKALTITRALLKPEICLLWEPIQLYVWDREYFSLDGDRLKEIYRKLADNKSQETLEKLVYAKLSHNGTELLLLANSNQYFNEITKSSNFSEEVYVDCGAYDGDTIKKFVDFTNNNYKKIYAFEPNPSNYEKLIKNTKEYKNIEYVNTGTWSSTTTLTFSDTGSSSEIIGNIVDPEKIYIEVPVTTIDSVVENENVSFIKMDVEGSEMESLRGASNTIRRCHPKLAICCYHKQTDIVDFYNYITEFNDDEIKYEIYLRHHSNGAYETVFYAIPVQKLI